MWVRKTLRRKMVMGLQDVAFIPSLDSRVSSGTYV